MKQFIKGCKNTINMMVRDYQRVKVKSKYNNVIFLEIEREYNKMVLHRILVLGSCLVILMIIKVLIHML